MPLCSGLVSAVKKGTCPWLVCSAVPGVQVSPEKLTVSIVFRGVGSSELHRDQRGKQLQQLLDPLYRETDSQSDEGVSSDRAGTHVS